MQRSMYVCECVCVCLCVPDVQWARHPGVQTLVWMSETQVFALTLHFEAGSHCSLLCVPNFLVSELPEIFLSLPPIFPQGH